MNFDMFNLHPRIAAGIRAIGYAEPTPIQTQAIPLILQGRDVVGLAQTGTGKTAAFGLPILHRLFGDASNRGRVRALIVAPTRELAEQIHDAVNDMGRQTGVRSATIYGGVNINPQIHKLRAGVDIVVACPGRLLDHIGQGTIDLSGVEVLVLDEADRMLDMGFLPDVRRILKHLPSKRQTLMFSATMPDDIRQLSREALQNPATVQIGLSAPVHTVSHALYPVAPHLKTGLLMELLKTHRMESVLVFTRTKHRAKRVAQQLSRAGFDATSLQGNLSQNKRQAAMDGFRDGSYQIMVATDIAARGIDVAQISHVVNYDIPDTVDAYTHRIGRTGRAARTGDAFTLVTREDVAMIREIEAVLKAPLERRTVPGFDYNAPAPARDAEFVRPPRPATPRRPARRPEPRTAEPQKAGLHQPEPRPSRAAYVPARAAVMTTAGSGSPRPVTTTDRPSAGQSDLRRPLRKPMRVYRPNPKWKPA